MRRSKESWPCYTRFKDLVRLNCDNCELSTKTDAFLVYMSYLIYQGRMCRLSTEFLYNSDFLFLMKVSCAAKEALFLSYQFNKNKVYFVIEKKVKYIL